MAHEDLPPDFLQSPLLPGLEVARNSGFVDSSASARTLDFQIFSNGRRTSKWPL